MSKLNLHALYLGLVAGLIYALINIMNDSHMNYQAAQYWKSQLESVLETQHYSDSIYCGDPINNHFKSESEKSY